MNSLLQTLYMTPEFRRALYLWRYDEAEDCAAEDCIPLQLQRLFGRLQLDSRRAVPTEALTQSFGWSDGDAFTQHDVQVPTCLPACLFYSLIQLLSFV
jgi:ubiquitin carboxyl-terminal hydrolase 47